jgi:hypothetical protein
VVAIREGFLLHLLLEMTEAVEIRTFKRMHDLIGLDVWPYSKNPIRSYVFGLWYGLITGAYWI